MENFWLSRREDEIKIRVDAAVAKVRKELEDDYNKRLEECYEEAYQMITEFRKIIERKEVLLSQGYEEKLKQQKDFIINKVDEYLKVYLLTLSEKELSDVMGKKIVEDALK